MLFTFLACTYISIVCWAWGRLLFIAFNKLTRHEPEFHFSITCIAGLSHIMALAGVLSLFFPLGGWMIQLLLLFPTLFILYGEYNSKFKIAVKDIFSLLPAAQFLLLISLMIVLVMSTWKIIHPDTLGYHAQLIQWAEKYKAIPGLVNLNARYGLQSNWFLACALFDFKFTGSQALLYLNSTVLFWFIIFIVNKINGYLRSSEKPITGLFWIALFGFSFWSYTQVRLMATSASPDFFACILIWLSLYIFTLKKEQPGPVLYPDYFLIALFCTTAITVKLSALPVLFIIFSLFYFLSGKKKTKYIFITGGILIAVLLPLFIRNTITSGYPLFPSVYGNFPVDWKLDEATTRQIAGYVTVYSRTALSYSGSSIQNVLQMNPAEWLPVWWRILSSADKTILVLLVLSIIALLINVKKILRADHKSIIALFACSVGLIFWFIFAPDPRFGFGFIFGFMGITGQLVIARKESLLLSSIKKIVLASVMIIGILLSVYMVYRFSNFYSPNQWLKPMGTEKVGSKTVTCDGIKMNVQLNTLGCGDEAIPCSWDSCGLFSARGPKLTDGFRAK